MERNSSKKFPKLIQPEQFEVSTNKGKKPLNTRDITYRALKMVQLQSRAKLA